MVAAIDVLKKYKRYNATVQLKGLEVFIGNELLSCHLVDAGFSAVKVEGSGGTRTITATWSRDDKPVHQVMPANLRDRVTEFKEV